MSSFGVHFRAHEGEKGDWEHSRAALASRLREGIIPHFSALLDHIWILSQGQHGQTAVSSAEALKLGVG